MRYSLVAALASLFTTALAADHLVLVGDGGLKFNPNVVTAANGDTVTFEFRAKNHSVTQSTFVKPCEIQQTPATGVDSGFQFVKNGSTTFAQWKITIDNASAPLWFFCAQANHCQQGMVFAINPNAEKSFETYLENAKASTPSTNSTAGSPSSVTGSVPAGGATITGAGTVGGALKTSFTMVPTSAVTNTQGGPPPSLAAASASSSASTLSSGAYRMNLPTTSVLALVGFVAGLAL